MSNETTFDEMGLRENVLRGVYSYGFERPSLIQQKAILPFVNGKDLIAQSQSGTGKTGTFVISTLQRINVEEKTTQALILLPIRELATQVNTVIQGLGSHIQGLTTEVAIGGVRSSTSRHPAHIVIGTPGRVFDNLQHKHLNLDHLKVIVLDEADEMLSRGFIDQVHSIFQYVPKTTQVALFSATMSPEVIDISKKFMDEPLQILVKNEELTLDGIRQFYVVVRNREEKYSVILDLFDVISVTQSIIYANTKREVEQLYEKLTSNKFSVGLITGNMAQDYRNEVMYEFRQGKTRVLLSTDMLARGIDIQQISLVVNFDLPREKETYIHRIGRSGRFGRKGVAINIITPDDISFMKELEGYYSTYVEELPSNIADLL